MPQASDISFQRSLVTALPTPDTKLFMFSGLADFLFELHGGLEWHRQKAEIHADYSNVIPSTTQFSQLIKTGL
jgi:hypothetical protein